MEHGQRIDRLTASAATLEISATSPDVPFTTSLQATGDYALGKGTRGAIPLILNFEARDLVVTPKRPLTWSIRLKMLAGGP